MRTHIYRSNCFAFYDRSNITRHLETMAQRGWQLEGIGGVLGLWRYRRCEPQALRYAVSYLPSATDYDPLPDQEKEAFYELCAHSGWTLAAESASLQIFCSGAADPLPLETDPVVEVETIRRAARRHFWPAIVWIAVLSVICLLGFWAAPRTPEGQLAGLFGAGMLVFFLTESLSFLRWLRRAEAAGQQGVFLPTPKSSPLRRWMDLFAWAALAVLVVFLYQREAALWSVLPGVLGCCIGLGLKALRENLRRDGVPAGRSRELVLLFGGFLVVFVAVVLAAVR